MVATCSMKGCKNVRSEKKPGLFCIPKIIFSQGEQTTSISKDRRMKWLSAIRRTEDTVRGHTRICGKHFGSGRPSALYDQTNPDWIPSLLLDNELPKGASAGKVGKISANVKRYERRINRSKLQRQSQVTKLNEVCSSNSSSAQSSNNYTLQLPNTVEQVTTLIKIEPGCDNFSFTECQKDSTEIITACENESLRSTGNVSSEETEGPVFKIETVPAYDPSINLYGDALNVPITLLELHASSSIMTSDKASQVDLAHTQVPPTCTFNTGTQTDDSIMRHKNEQANLRFNYADVEVQTLFRVCELFELESAMLKIKEAQTKIDILNKSLAEAHECVNQYRAKIESLNPEMEMLKKELQKRSYSESYFRNDNDKVKYYTGFVHFRVLDNVHNEVKHRLMAHCKLSTFQQCVLIFMKLKHSLMNKELAYRFNISERSVGRIVYHSLDALYK